MNHAVKLADVDPLLREFLSAVAVDLSRLEALGAMPRAVALRADLWPEMASAHGYPIVRLASSSKEPWGVLV